MKDVPSWIFIVIAICAALVGCAGINAFLNNHEAAAKAAVQVATIEFLKANPNYVPPLVQIADAARAAVEGREIESFEAAAVYVRHKIRYEKLLPEEAVLLDNLIDVARDELATLLREQGVEKIPEEVRAKLSLVLTWVGDAGRRMMTNNRG